jgi:hypothetical protein
VRTALRAAARRAAGDLFRAAAVACRASARGDAAARDSRFKAPLIARDRRGDGRLAPRLAARLAYSALCFVLAFAVAGGRGSFTPARLAFESPMAIACLVERAPCFPSRMWCISSRTNSPACVVGAFPSRLSCWARLTVSCSGIQFPREPMRACPVPETSQPKVRFLVVRLVRSIRMRMTAPGS